MSFTTEARFASLEKLILAAKATSQSDPLIAEHLCRLACIQICGNIERCVELLIMERFDKRIPPQVVEFLSRYFRRGTNFDCDEICAFLFRFDSNWGRKFEAFVNTNHQVKTQINGCYGIRNVLAHGGGHTPGYKAAQEYFDASKILIAKFEEVIK